MNLWSQYLQERLGKHVLERDEGFAVYSFVPWYDKVAVYIEEIYVTPNAREKRLASDMADEIGKLAKEAGCDVMVGSVAPNANGATRSLKVLLGYGFQLAAIDPTNNLIMFSKDI